MPLPLLALGAIGAGSSLLGGLFGGDKPDAPPPINIDPTGVQRETVRGNIANFGDISTLASQYNQFSADQLAATLERMMPGYGALQKQGTETISSYLRGEVPKDVERMLNQRAAERGIALGTSGSQFSQYDTLRNLGLLSLDLTRQGLQAANSWLASAPRAPQFDASSMFFTPQQRLNFEFQQAQHNAGVEFLENQLDAMPGPLENAAGSFFDWVGGVGRNVAGMEIGRRLASPSPQRYGSSMISPSPNYTSDGYTGGGFDPGRSWDQSMF